MSGRKNNLRQFRSVVDGDMTTNIVSAITSIQWLDNVGIQLNWTGAPVGTFEVQVSADYVQDINGEVTNPGNWIPLVLSYFNGPLTVNTTDIPTSVGSPIYFDLNELSAPWIRITYTAGSGSGVLNAYITAKML